TTLRIQPSNPLSCHINKSPDSPGRFMSLFVFENDGSEEIFALGGDRPDENRCDEAFGFGPVLGSTAASVDGEIAGQLLPALSEIDQSARARQRVA
ncbi:hypothetical protein, partial [Nocardia gipuzkoensis]